MGCISQHAFLKRVIDNKSKIRIKQCYVGNRLENFTDLCKYTSENTQHVPRNPQDLQQEDGDRAVLFYLYEISDMGECDNHESDCKVRRICAGIVHFLLET